MRAAVAPSAEYVTSVCTGALILARPACCADIARPPMGSFVTSSIRAGSEATAGEKIVRQAREAFASLVASAKKNAAIARERLAL
jgi:hypothetical protein